MEKGKIKEKIDELEETYSKVNEQIEKLNKQKNMIEGKYQAYMEILQEQGNKDKNKEDVSKEIGE